LPVTFSAAQKEKPGGGNAGSDFFSYRSLRFQLCGLAVALLALKSAERLVVIFQPILFFFFFYFLVLL